jgi:hypothetical protein
VQEAELPDPENLLASKSSQLQVQQYLHYYRTQSIGYMFKNYLEEVCILLLCFYIPVSSEKNPLISSHLNPAYKPSSKRLPVSFLSTTEIAMINNIEGNV